MNLDTFRKSFLLIFLGELISLSGFLVPEINIICFFTIISLTLYFSLKNQKYGLFILFAELFIGSKGYLFSFTIGELSISIRMALWLIVMSVWLFRTLESKLKTGRFGFNKYVRTTTFRYAAFLFIFIAWGLVSGLINNNGFLNIFFDVNGWLFFAIIFPVLHVFAQSDDKTELIRDFLSILFAAASWLAVESYFLLYVFSHNFIGMIEELYRWVRITGVGEITQMQGGFYRIFIQSHIFVLAAFYIALMFFAHKLDVFKGKAYKDKELVFSYLALTILISVNILNFSRSNWVGLAVGLLIAFIFMLTRIGFKKTFIVAASLLISILLGVGLLTATVKFPFPDPMGGFNTVSLLKDRAMELSGEAALSTRWALFPVLYGRILEDPILGQGFGATITYKSSDPRVLEMSPSGEFTTYAFEWGWLDIWLKLGILGITFYIAFIFKISAMGMGKLNDQEEMQNFINAGLVISLITIAVISFFSPYLNHPLGIGYILLIAAIIEHNRPRYNIFNWFKRLMAGR